MKRIKPKRFDEILAIAKAAKLKNPVGRTCYIINRINNGGFSGWSSGGSQEYWAPSGVDAERVLEKMKTIKPETAFRWLKHWRAGGSLKSLSHGSHGRSDEGRKRENELKKMMRKNRDSTKGA